jgi:hypothetical protein
LEKFQTLVVLEGENLQLALAVCHCIEMSFAMQALISKGETESFSLERKENPSFPYTTD